MVAHHNFGRDLILHCFVFAHFNADYTNYTFFIVFAHFNPDYTIQWYYNKRHHGKDLWTV